MKISGYVEQIFAQAVALDQSGGLRNTIYALGKEIYILNFDHSLILRFGLRKSEAPFSQKISFRANDYDSEVFYEEEGKIVFVTEKSGFIRKKNCGTPDFTPAEIKEVFAKYDGRTSGQVISLPKEILSLLDRDLSHIEFSGEKGKALRLIQRNVYSGGIIEITRKEKGFFKTDNIEASFGPIGIKTGDFAALFNFQDILRFTFPTGKDDGNFIRIDSTDKLKRDMVGFIAGCLYDEIIQIKEASNEEPKLRRKK